MNNDKTINKSLQCAHDDCIKRLDNLISLKISPQNNDGSLLSDEEFKAQKEMITRERNSLKEKLSGVNSTSDKWQDLSEKTFNFASYAQYWMSNGDDDTKKQIVLGIGSNQAIINKTVRIDVLRPFEMVEEAKKSVSEISPRFEPTKKGFTEAQMHSFYSQNPTLLPRLDSNQQPSSYRTPSVAKRSGLSHHPR